MQMWTDNIRIQAQPYLPLHKVYTQVQAMYEAFGKKKAAHEWLVQP